MGAACLKGCDLLDMFGGDEATKTINPDAPEIGYTKSFTKSKKFGSSFFSSEVSISGSMGFKFKYDTEQCLFEGSLDSGTFTITGPGINEEFTPLGLNFEVDGNKAKISVEKGSVTGTVILERTGTSDPCCFNAWKVSLEVEVGPVSGDIDIGEFDLTETADQLGVSLCI